MPAAQRSELGGMTGAQLTLLCSDILIDAVSSNPLMRTLCHYDAASGEIGPSCRHKTTGKQVTK